MREEKLWPSGEELFRAALTHDPSERVAFVRTTCGENEQLRDAVESLLLAHEMSRTAADQQWPHRFREATPEDAQAQKSIGAYRLIEKIGQGGMGQVWLAEQTAPLQRQVALKLVRAGSYDPSLLQRFQSERQSLAMMDHPAIAKVFEAGAAPNGQPYLVMEYVRGFPITDYCDQKKLAIRDRLELFVKVCEGVQHAHQKAIIHRDLKPSNILVAEVDKKPLPRIIDFGLAKATAPLKAGEEALTREGVAFGTPGYMSPEQADPGVEDIDTRSDVYSLGVVLYELLTGFLPFDLNKWKKLPLHEALRQLREEDPLRPSARMRLEKDASTPPLRGMEPKQLIGLLEGDLDSIATKAIDKNRNRRYGTPSELAADIGRYLRHEPVIARAASVGYRVQKYVRRHVFAVGVTTGLVLLLVAVAALQAVQLRRITRERDRADRVTEFMTGMFKVSDPSEARGNTITAREILDRASKEIDSGLAKDPELQAQMMVVMGQVYLNLGLYERARGLLTTALDVARRAVGPTHGLTLQAMSALGLALNSGGHFADAEKVLRETSDLQRRILGADHPDTLRSMSSLSGSLHRQGRLKEAEQLQRTVLEKQERVLGLEHVDVLKSMNNLTIDLVNLGRSAEAEAVVRKALELDRRMFGSDHPETWQSMLHLGLVLVNLDRFAEAVQVGRESLEVARRVFGPDHPKTLKSMMGLGVSLYYLRSYAEAEQLHREAMEIQRRVLGAEHFETLRSAANLGTIIGKQGRYAEAETLLRQTIATQRRVLGPDHAGTALSIYGLAGVEALKGDRDEALRLLRDAVDHGLTKGQISDLETDEDLKSLRDDPRFAELLAYAKKRVASAGTSK